MREKIKSVPFKRKTFLMIVIVMIALAGVTPVLADYLGPNRTITETISICKVILYECKLVSGSYRYHKVDGWSCANESKPWKAYSNQPSSQGCFDATAGDTYWVKEDIIQTVTNTYPPATISGALQNCTLNNGWCITIPQLSMSGTEPVSGYNIIAIEGFINGQNFACANASCSVPLFEGNNNLSYWALSSWGDSSFMGTLTTKVDSQAPNITGALSGASGSNGWYLGPVSFKGSASDLNSGLATFTCSLDGVVLGSCSSISIAGDGTHTLALSSTDNAGNVSNLIKTASLDTQNPLLNAGVSGTLGSNNWYTSAMLSATASDPTPGSGVLTFEYNLDNSTWLAFPSAGELTLPEGKHIVDIRAIDKAGRATSASKSFWLDSVAPTLTVSSTGTSGLNNWYTTDVDINASASDDISGMDVFEYSLDNNPWTAYLTPLTLSDGPHTLSFWAQDRAGLVKQMNRNYQVDTRPPQIAGTIDGITGLDSWYISDVALSASASDPIPGSGLDAFTYILDNDPSTLYTTPLSLTDGQHTIQFNAQDQAGLSYSIDQVINVDTTRPDLTISATLPAWVKNNVTLAGTAGDNGSGLSKIEISVDNGQTWQVAAGTTSWNYDWNTQNSADGSYNVQVRATDKAGLITEKAIAAGVDNHSPKISMPASWLQWDTVTIDISDDFSGISEATIEISDPNANQSKRLIKLDPQGFPLSFKWDRRFDDGSIAPFGTYDIRITAIDSLGNTAQQNASVKVLLSILPPGPTATLPPYTPPAATPTPINTSIPTATRIASPTATPTAMTRVFGAIEPTQQILPTPTSISTPRATPTRASVQDGLKSIFATSTEAATETTEVVASSAQSAHGRAMDSQSDVLWGAAAAAMVGAVTAYAAEERRKQEEEKARQAALEAEAEERHAKMQARRLEKMEAQRQQEAAWEAARHEQEQLENAREQKEQIDSNRAELKDQSIEKEINSFSAEAQEWTSSYSTYMVKKAEEEKAELIRASMASYSAATRQEDKAANWWDSTKSFISNQIIQPFASSIYEPIIEPAINRTKQFVASETAWMNENIYQLYLQPAIEKDKEFLVSETGWIKKNIYEPYLESAVENNQEFLVNEMAWISENIYQPYLKPAIENNKQFIASETAWIKENIYEPFIEPVVSTLNEKVYQPYIQPALNDYKKLVYDPIFKPVVDDVTTWGNDLWDEYGEWVHSALDYVGFVPGLGDIGDGLNGLIYLAEGRYLEASISTIAMIPLLGDLGKAGKLTLKVGSEVIEEAAEKAAKELAEELVEDVAKETLEEAAEQIVKETTEELLEKTSAELVEEATEKTLKNVEEDVANTIVKESLEEGAEKALRETSQELVQESTTEATDQVITNAVKNTTTATTTAEKATDKISDVAIEGVSEKAVEHFSEETTQRILSDIVPGKVTKVPADVAESLTQESAAELAQKISNELGGKKVWVSAKTGLIYVSSPPAEGFLLAERLRKTDLTNREEVEKILKSIAELTTRGAGDHVVLGPFAKTGAFIQEALDTNGVFWDVGDELWTALEESGIDMFKANDQFLRVQIERGIGRFDVINTDVSKVINKINDGPPIEWKNITFTQKEIIDLATMPDLAYQLEGNSWVRIDLTDNIK